MRIVVDTSAMFAVLRHEPEGERYEQVLINEHVVMSAATYVEAVRVCIASGNKPLMQRLHAAVAGVDMDIIPFDAAQARLAEEGMRRFGKGRAAAPAVLNFGDLFPYALARALDAPLLFKGDDFGQTDVRIHQAVGNPRVPQVLRPASPARGASCRRRP